MKRIGYWLSEKKYRKMGFGDFEDLCKDNGYDIVRLDLQKSLEGQGPFDVILHKVTDIKSQAEVGDTECVKYMENLEQIQQDNMDIICNVHRYLENHPETILLDPINNIYKLSKRQSQYSMIRDCFESLADPNFFIPTFVELTGSDVEANKRLIQDAGVTYPFVFKPAATHGSPISHHLALIFNEEGLRDLRPPCVAQSFSNHNAILYKVYVVGDEVKLVERPSVKNFKSGRDANESTIFFDSHGVSKPNCNSFLNQLDATDEMHSEMDAKLPEINMKKIDKMVKSLRKAFGLDLLGIDLIIEQKTERYGVIDINYFPGYDGFGNLFDTLLRFIEQKAEQRGRRS